MIWRGCPVESGIVPNLERGTSQKREDHFSKAATFAGARCERRGSPNTDGVVATK